ncbi:hypothetical protein [Kitasatospora sp. NPDC001683]
MNQTISRLTDGAALSADAYDTLTCCGQPVRVAHSTETLPVAGAICETCWCTVTSIADYGPITIRRCNHHGS